MATVTCGNCGMSGVPYPPEEVDQLRAEVERLRKALRRLVADCLNSACVCCDGLCPECNPVIGALKKASDVLGEK